MCAIRHTTLQVVQKIKIHIYLFNVKGHVHGKYVTSFQILSRHLLRRQDVLHVEITLSHILIAYLMSILLNHPVTIKPKNPWIWCGIQYFATHIYISNWDYQLRVVIYMWPSTMRKFEWNLLWSWTTIWRSWPREIHIFKFRSWSNYVLNGKQIHGLQKEKEKEKSVEIYFTIIYIANRITIMYCLWHGNLCLCCSNLFGFSSHKIWMITKHLCTCEIPCHFHVTIPSIILTELL